jgi:hypothetical protein
MKELDMIIKKGTKSFSQIESSTRAYIYRVTDTETDHVYYEVFERRFNRRFKCISYPTDKAFGKWAWCISKGEDHLGAHKAALKRFNFINVLKEAA